MFLGLAVLWGGYTLAWWGWLAMTDRVPVGSNDSVWWPSIQDLIVPGKAGNLTHTALQAEQQLAQSSAATQAQGNQPLTGVPANPRDPLLNPIEPASLKTQQPFDWTTLGKATTA